jgi:chemotaxis protein MotB
MRRVRRQRRYDEHENHERWLVSYADFITLLFAFFAVLYATSQSDVRKQEEFQQSIRENLAAGVFGFGSGSQYDQLNDPRNNSFFKPIMQNFPPKSAGSEEVQQYVEGRVKKEVSGGEDEKTVSGIRHDAIGVRIELAAGKLFAVGSADLKVESLASLDKIAELLKESNRSLIIEGHTDDQPIHTEKFPSNWELSSARATKIVRYLMVRHKIAASRLTAVAYADQKPVVPNTSEENRARNRRIEVMIITGNKNPAL